VKPANVAASGTGVKARSRGNSIFNKPNPLQTPHQKRIVLPVNYNSSTSKHRPAQVFKYKGMKT